MGVICVARVSRHSWLWLWVPRGCLSCGPQTGNCSEFQTLPIGPLASPGVRAFRLLSVVVAVGAGWLPWKWQ